MILELTLPTYPNIVQRVAKKETNDCVVLALHWAAGISYDESHAIYKRLGRRHRKGVDVATTLAAIVMTGWFPKTQGVRFIPRSVKSWLDYGVGMGRVLVVLKDHIFAVVDGVPMDGNPLNTEEPVFGVIRLCHKATAGWEGLQCPAPASTERQKESPGGCCSEELKPLPARRPRSKRLAHRGPQCAPAA